MRIVNLAHGSLFLIGGYLGYEVATASGSWLLAFPIVFIVVALIGLLMQCFIFSKMEGEELRQTLVSIGLSIVFADLMLWWWGGQSYSILAPQFLQGPMELPLVSNFNDETGAVTWLRYPAVRVWILVAAIVIGVAMWLVLNRTALGMLIRAGVDDREMLAASGVRIQLVFLAVFGFGAGLAGVAGIIGDSDWNVAPMIPAIPASPAPNPNTARNTRWMRTPEAASISRSSTPARISMPSAVRFKTSHIATPITIAATSIQTRTDG